MATLKISDLSVGDWVEWKVYDESYDILVTQITDTLIRGVHDGIEYGMLLKQISPIPITPEILEKNGFEEHCSGIYRYEWIWQGESSGITLCSFDEELWFVNLFFKEGKDIMCNIPTFSVHQLQHILRLAGVEKEIVMQITDDFRR